MEDCLFKFPDNPSGGLMKNFQKTILFCVVILFCATSPAFSQKLFKAEELQKNADKFIDSLAKSLPFNSTLGLNWSDAYIGQIPHFGIGISAGATTMDYASLSDLISQFDLNMSFDNSSTFKKMGLPIPGYTVETRIGGFIIPIDFGIKFGYISTGAFESMLGKFSDNKPTFGFENMLIGGDVRFSPLNKKVFPVKLSVGLGFNYMKGKISAALPNTLLYSFTYDSVDYIISQNTGQLGIEWRTSVLELKTQVSFPLKFITPYAGVGISYAFSQAGYRVDSKISATKNGAPVNINDVEKLLEESGLTGISETGFEYIKKNPSFNSRAFGGFSFNLAFFRLDLTGMYNFRGGDFGITVGTRFQL